jgi:3-oxoacyl-[acyl-carrier-protein] synthase III
VIHAEIRGTGSYLPERVMTNADWAKRVDTSDEWIVSRTGIRERHFAAPEQAASDLATEAASLAIANAGVSKGDIDLVIVGTISPDNAYPSTACWVQKKLGLRHIPAYDTGAACCGFLFSLIQAEALIRTGVVRHVLVIGVEVLSKFMNWEDRNTCVLFGDGAGAVVLGPSHHKKGIISSCWGADGNLGDLLMQPAGGSAMPPTHETVDKKLHTVSMKGNEVFKHAVLRMQESAIKAIALAGLTAEQIDLCIPHQANNRIIEATIKRANIPAEKTYNIIHRIANISSATIPIALDHARQEGRIQPDNNVLLVGFGGGFTWAGIVIKF